MYSQPFNAEPPRELCAHRLGQNSCPVVIGCWLVVSNRSWNDDFFKVTSSDMIFWMLGSTSNQLLQVSQLCPVTPILCKLCNLVHLQSVEIS